MNAPVSSDVTLLTEHFTYRPAALIDDIVNSINILSFRATEAVEKGLSNAPLANLGFRLPTTNPPTPESLAAVQEVEGRARHEIENGVHQLETLLEAKIDKNFDKLELYAFRNILKVDADVRDWVRLSHYAGLRFGDGGSVDDEGPNTESITLQRKKMMETLKLHSLLRAEEKRNETTIRELKALILGEKPKQEPEPSVKEEGDAGSKEHQVDSAFAFLGDKGGLTGDVETSTSFTLSQVTALKSLLRDLGPRLEELSNGSGKDGKGIGEEEKSFRRERLEFIEKGTRRHLENVRGLELGEQGEVRDGEWQGEGRRLLKGEVEDLERVVGIIGGGEGEEKTHESK